MCKPVLNTLQVSLQAPLPYTHICHFTDETEEAWRGFLSILVDAGGKRQCRQWNCSPKCFNSQENSEGSQRIDWHTEGPSPLNRKGLLRSETCSCKLSG